MTTSGVWYPVCGLKRDGLPVVLCVGAGAFVGFRKTYARPRPLVWQVQKGPNAELRRAWSKTIWRIRQDGKLIDLPPHSAPTLFRPIDPSKYPDPLPMPASVVSEVRWQRPRAPRQPYERPDALEWANRYSSGADISRREAEVRVLRALRLDREMDDGAFQDNNCLSMTAIIEIKAKGRIEYEYKDPSYLPNARVYWAPTNKDYSDYERAMSWFRTLSERERIALWMRSANPSHKFEKIGEVLHVSKQRAKQIYDRAIEIVHAMAARGEE